MFKCNCDQHTKLKVWRHDFNNEKSLIRVYICKSCGRRYKSIEELDAEPYDQKEVPKCLKST